MKNLTMLVASILVLSCQKSEIKPRVFVKSFVSFRASYVNEVHNNECDSIYISVQGSQSFAFVTHNNPCLNISYGFNMWANDSISTSPYIIRTERDTLEQGFLTFTIDGVSLVKV